MTSTSHGEFQSRWTTGAELLAAIERTYGLEAAFRSPRLPWVWHLACLACRSKPLRARALHLGYPLTLARLDARYVVAVGCRCEPERVASEIARRYAPLVEATA